MAAEARRRCLLSLLFLACAASAQTPEEAGCNRIESVSLQMQGREELARHHAEAAARHFEQALIACPVAREVLLDLSQAYGAQREFGKAIRAAEQYVSAKPTSVEGRVMLANAYFMAQRFTEANDEADRVLRLDSGQPAALKIKGNIEYFKGHVEAAKNIFVELIDRNPQDEDAPYMLGRMYYQEGAIDLATGQFERVLKLNPRSYKAFDNLGLCYESKGDTDKATRYFLTAIKIAQKDAPDYDWAYANLADMLIKHGNNQKGFDAASMAADRNPASARNFYLGGKALLNLGKYGLARNWLERSTSLDPAYPQPLYLLVRVYHKLGMEEKSAEAQRKFLAAQAKAPAVRR